MAVVKIVPMPGVAVVGPMGAQGPIGLTGPAGTNGTNGTNGADGTELNFWNFVGDPGVPTVDGLLVVDGISGRSETGQGNVSIFAGPTASIVLAGNGGEFLKDTNIPANQIATIGDIQEVDTLTNGLLVTGQIDDSTVNPAGTMSLSVQDGYTALMDLVAHSATFNGDVQVTNLSGTRITTIETPTTINNELSIQTEYGEGWTFDNNGYILGPWLSAAEDPGNTGRYLRVNGITRADNNPLLVSSSGPILINGTGGEFLNFHGDPNNQIATIGDLTTPTSGTWDPRFAELSGITYSNSEQYEVGTYYCVGDLVFFDITVHLGYVSNWGNPSAPTYNNFKFKLPFEMPNSGLGVIGQSGPGTRTPFLGQILENYTDPEDPLTWSMFPVFGLSASISDEVNVYSTMGGMNQSLQIVTSVWPSNFNESQGGSNSSFSMSGVYRKA